MVSIALHTDPNLQNSCNWLLESMQKFNQYIFVEYFYICTNFFSPRTSLSLSESVRVHISALHDIIRQLLSSNAILQQAAQELQQEVQELRKRLKVSNFSCLMDAIRRYRENTKPNLLWIRKLGWHSILSLDYPFHLQNPVLNQGT